MHGLEGQWEQRTESLYPSWWQHQQQHDQQGRLGRVLTGIIITRSPPKRFESNSSNETQTRSQRPLNIHTCQTLKACPRQICNCQCPRPPRYQKEHVWCWESLVTQFQLEFHFHRCQWFSTVGQSITMRPQHQVKQQRKSPSLNPKSQSWHKCTIWSRPSNLGPSSWANQFSPDAEATRLPGRMPSKLTMHLCTHQWTSHLRIHWWALLTTDWDPITSHNHSKE